MLPEGDFNGKQAFAGNEAPEAMVKIMSTAASAWPLWKGHWGDPDGGALSPGPRSPGQQERFRDPLVTTSCTDRWVGANNKYACAAASTRGAGLRTTAPPAAGSSADAVRFADVDECDPWFGPMIAVGTCDAAIVREAIEAGTLGQATAGIEASGAANANGVAQLAGVLTPAAPPVHVAAASGLIYARAAFGRQTVEALYDARPGGLVVKAARDALGRPLLRVRDRGGRLVAPRATYKLHARPLARPTVRALRRTATVATLRVRGAASVRITGAGVRDVVRTVRAGRVRLTVGRSARSLRVAAVARGRVSSRPVTVKLPRAGRAP